VSLFLTTDELRELTGLRVAAYQCKWLEKHGYVFETNASGKPKVLRIFLMQKLGMARQQSIGLGTEPNFEALT